MRAQPSEYLHGVVSRRELLADGVGRRAVAHRLSNGGLHRKYAGVYAIGRPDLSVWGERRAIVLACGETAVLSHRSAAGAWAIRPDNGTTWDVTIAAGARRCPAAPVRLHRSDLPPWQVAVLVGIPITTVARTLLDLAAIVPAHHLRRAVERADQLELFDLRAVRRVLDAHPRRRGSRALRELLEDFRRHGVTMTRSDAEAAFLQIIIDEGLQRPYVNRYDDGREADFRWPDRRLIVEIDGYSTHRSRRAFTEDRVRDRRALVDGTRTARFTAYEIEHHRGRVARELEQLLRAGKDGGSGPYSGP
jgi:very-short-patch-repair endonuclease